MAAIDFLAVARKSPAEMPDRVSETRKTSRRQKGEPGKFDRELQQVNKKEDKTDDKALDKKTAEQKPAESSQEEKMTGQSSAREQQKNDETVNTDKEVLPVDAEAVESVADTQPVMQLIPLSVSEEGNSGTVNQAVSGGKENVQVQPTQRLEIPESAPKPTENLGRAETSVISEKQSSALKSAELLETLSRLMSGEEKAKGNKEILQSVKMTKDSTSGAGKHDAKLKVNIQLNQTPPQNLPEQKPENTTDVKKLIDFENNRLTSSKLTNSDNPNQENNAGKNDDTNKSLSLVTRLDTGTVKHSVREFNVPANKMPETKELIDQVVKKAQIMMKSNSSEMKIDLKPDFLGKMTIKILADDGVITARFITESHQVKHLLESNMNTLRHSLEAQGIKVEKTEVNVGLNNGGMFDGSPGGRQELWQKPQLITHYTDNQNYTDENGYEEIDDWVIGVDEHNYGVSVNGSMNFLV